MQTMISDPKSFFTERGGLHDARIRQIAWDALARAISVEVADLNANALGLPEYNGAEPGSILFRDANDLSLRCDAFANDIQRVYDIEIEEREGGRYRCTLLISPGGRLTFDFSEVVLIACPSSAAKAGG